MRAHRDPRIAAHVQFAFFTGMRPEEITALRWSDLDMQRAVAHVLEVRTFGGEVRDGTTTNVEREMDLMPDALAAIEVMRAYTGSSSDHLVIQSPVTGKPWHSERSQREAYWQPTLKRYGIATRNAYATRHTYCTLALMGDVRPACIASHAGHSVAMPLDTYARWIRRADAHTEHDRLVAALGERSSSTEIPRPVRPPKKSR